MKIDKLLNIFLTRQAYYIINGGIATIIHYIALLIMIDIIKISSAGKASFLASVIASTCSFIGNKYFVFHANFNNQSSQIPQIFRFVLLYCILALFHGGFLFIWTDKLFYNFTNGFIIVLLLQAVVGYLVGNHYVFKDKLIIMNK